MDNPVIVPCGAAGVVLWPRCAVIVHTGDAGCFAVPEHPFTLCGMLHFFGSLSILGNVVSGMD